MVKIKDIMNPDLLHRMAKEGYIRHQKHPSLPLYIWNYSEKCQFDKRWNEATLACRGLITTGPEVGEFDIYFGDMEIVARPWQKFFNYGEGRLRIDDTMPVEVTDKMDGSLGILYDSGEGFAIATRGSFASDQAIAASKIWYESYSHLDVPSEYTFLFEILLPWNRIVLSYDYDSEYLQQGRGALSSGSARNDTGKHLRPAKIGLEDLSSLQIRGTTQGSGEARREAEGERKEVELSEQREGFGTQGGFVPEDSSSDFRGEERQALHGLRDDISSGSDGLRSSSRFDQEVQHRTGEEFEATGRGNSEVRTSVRELSQSEDVRYTPGNLVLLGAVHVERGYYLGPQEAAGILDWTGPVTTVFAYRNIAEAFAADPRPNAEGFVVRSGTEIVKIKQVDYIELHRIVTNLSPLTLWRRLSAGETLDKLLESIPDEWHDWLREEYRKLTLAYREVEKRVWASYLEVQSKVPAFESRKEFAQVATRSPDSRYMFNMYDKKDIDVLIWNEIRPSGSDSKED